MLSLPGNTKNIPVKISVKGKTEISRTRLQPPLCSLCVSTMSPPFYADQKRTAISGGKKWERSGLMVLIFFGFVFFVLCSRHRNESPNMRVQRTTTLQHHTEAQGETHYCYPLWMVATWGGGLSTFAVCLGDISSIFFSGGSKKMGFWNFAITLR